jgi:uncharacterized membrane protein YcjF (UPF0283 family)
MSPKRDKKSNVWAESLDWRLIVFGVTVVGWMERLGPATYPQKDQKQGSTSSVIQSYMDIHSFIHSLSRETTMCK